MENIDNNNSEKAILKTLLYSDIFDFPLSKEELWHYLISEKKVGNEQFEEALYKLILQKTPNLITQKNGLYCLNGREEIIKKRKINIHEMHKKLRIAKVTAYFLSFIPTVYFIGISGSVGIGNAEKMDDIDFFIITKRNTMFTTRLFILAVLEMMNLRRKRREENPANKICVNLLIEENRLSWSPNKHDLFIAHEIVQMKPLFERNDMYRQFIQSNKWVTKYFPNALNGLPEVSLTKKATKYYTIQAISWFFNFFPIAVIIRLLQKAYMQKHRSSEVITNHLLAFHPHDYRKETLVSFHKKQESFFSAY